MKKKRENAHKTRKISVLRKKFVDYYLELGNGAQAAIKAGYSAKSAKAIASDLLTFADVMQYKEKREKELDDERIAKPREVLEFLTASMRGEIRDQFDLDPSLQDRLDAAKQLQKRYGMDKLAIVGGEDGDNPVKVESTVQIYLPDNGRDDDDTKRG